MLSHNDLANVLTEAGHPPISLWHPDGYSILVTSYGGRILGLYASDTSVNFFWTNPHLDTPSTSHDVFNSNEWINLGGDRTWIGPEVDTFIGDLSNAWNTYRVPQEIDPGQYTASNTTNRISLAVQGSVPLHRKHKRCSVQIERHIRLIPNPLRLDTRLMTTQQLTYAGYEQTTTVRLTSPYDPDVLVDLWNLIVVPPSGWIIVPTFGQTAIRDYLAPSGPDRLRQSDRFAYFRVDGREQHKIAVRAAALVGRAGYLHDRDDGIRTLVVRNFQVNPSGEYIDVPWTDNADMGYALQAYNDSGIPVPFGELEYHTPAIGGANGITSHTETSQVWAFAGAPSTINDVCEAILGAGILFDTLR